MLTARRFDRLAALAAELREQHGTESHLVSLDVRDVGVVARTLGALPAEWPVDILVNNAGLARGTEALQDGDPRDWDEVLDTNVKGLLYVTRALLPGMIERCGGHIINIGSVAGHEVYPGGAVYCASKHAVAAITRGLRMDLLGTPVRVSSIDPGLVETDFSLVRFRGDEERARAVYEGYRPLAPEDVADAVVFAASRPLHVNIDEIILKPTARASAMLVNRTA